MAETTDSPPFKRCTVCFCDFPATVEHFHPNKGGAYGLRGQCRKCRTARVNELNLRPEAQAKRKTISENYITSGGNAARSRAWRLRNLDKERASRRKYRAANVEKLRQSDQKRRDNNREAVRAKQRRADIKLQQNPEHVLKKRIKARLRQMLKGTSLGSTEKILGYTRSQLVNHIERQFKDGMNWELLMRGEIHVDHILPVSSFKIDGIDSSEFRACWALSNLRPLWAIDNQKKQAKVLTLL